MEQIKLFEAVTRLDGFKNNIPQTPNSVQESYVHQYHLILDLLEEVIRINLNGFRVPLSELNYLISSYDADSQETTYTKERFCKRPFLMMKVDAVLSFLTFQMQNNKKDATGFHSK